MLNATFGNSTVLSPAIPLSPPGLPSPIGEVFRSRLRQFPSLVNCCTIDWFSEWPDEALQSVARSFLGELPELDSAGVSRQSVCLCVCVCSVGVLCCCRVKFSLVHKSMTTQTRMT